MYQRFLTYIKKEKLIENHDRLLIGVSGGVDSMVLAFLILKLKVPFAVAHVNYKLRGVESDGDANLVKSWCQSHHVEFHQHVVDPKAYEVRESIQMVARDIRYAFYNRLVTEYGYTKILTAHNANDNLETVLFNLTKGTGIAGLTGIAPAKDNLIRPLLFATKEEIYAFAKSNDIPWREDKSNAKSDYARNLIRNEVIPLLKQINPKLVTTFQSSQKRLVGVSQMLLEQKNTILQHLVPKNEKQAELLTEWVKDDYLSLTLLAEVVKDYGLNFQDTQDLHKAILARRSGALFFSSDYQLSVDRERLFISPRDAQDTVRVQVWKKDDHINTSMANFSFFEITTRPDDLSASDVAFLDADRVSYPITIRNWQTGDYFYPLGMGGKKKISDFMIDLKIPVSLKGRVLVVECAGEVVWVVGYRIDDRFKITSQTKKILKIEYTPC